MTDDIAVEDDDSVLGGEWSLEETRQYKIGLIIMFILPDSASMVYRKAGGRLSDPGRFDLERDVPPDESIHKLGTHASTSPENVPSIADSSAHKLVLTAIGTCWVTLKPGGYAV
jgi:hypothetical protein